MNRTIVLGAALLAVVAGPLIGCAAEPAARAPAAVDASIAGRRVTDDDVAHKLVLVNRMLDDSPVTRRVAASDDRRAKRLLSDARRVFERAKSALNGGDLQRADGFLDDALRFISEAGRAVPERERVLAMQRARYAQLLEGIETFRAWNERVAKQKRIDARTASSVAADADQTRAIIKGAAALERAGDVAAANKLLAEAHADITWVLNQLVANETLVYRQDFASPQDAYRYESDRYASYEELLPIAVSALLPSASAGAAADRRFIEAEEFRAAARAAADAGRHDEALVKMRDAVQRLQQAFAGMGVVVPQQMPEGT